MLTVYKHMEIRIEHVKVVLDELIADKLTREQASAWAFSLRELADENKLIFSPEKDEQILWESVLFIEGVDLQNEPNVYLHNNNDIRNFKERIESHE